MFFFFSVLKGGWGEYPSFDTWSVYVQRSFTSYRMPEGGRGGGRLSGASRPRPLFLYCKDAPWSKDSGR